MKSDSVQNNLDKSTAAREFTNSSTKIKLGLLVLGAVSASGLAIGRVVAQQQAKLNAATTANLSTAMHGEAFAYIKYSLYAQHARKDGNVALANLYEQTAKTERMEHLKEEAVVAGLVGDDVANLKDAIQGESYEFDTMYKGFADDARKVGDTVAAQRFDEIRQDEAKHRDAFKAALTKLEGAKTKK